MAQGRRRCLRFNDRTVRNQSDYFCWTIFDFTWPRLNFNLSLGYNCYIVSLLCFFEHPVLSVYKAKRNMYLHLMLNAIYFMFYSTLIRDFIKRFMQMASPFCLYDNILHIYVFYRSAKLYITDSKWKLECFESGVCTQKIAKAMQPLYDTYRARVDWFVSSCLLTKVFDMGNPTLSKFAHLTALSFM